MQRWRGLRLVARLTSAISRTDGFAAEPSSSSTISDLFSGQKSALSCESLRNAFQQPGCSGLDRLSGVRPYFATSQLARASGTSSEQTTSTLQWPPSQDATENNDQLQSFVHAVEKQAASESAKTGAAATDDPHRAQFSARIEKKTDLHRLRIGELKEQLLLRNLDVIGKKTDLVERLWENILEERGEDVLEDRKKTRPGRKSRYQQEVQEEADEERKRRESPPLAQEKRERLDKKKGYAYAFKPDEAAELLVKAKCEKVIVIDLKGRCNFTDYFVVGSGRSKRHVYAAASAVLHELKGRCNEVVDGVVPAIEGEEGQEWLCLDAGSVVVHVFMPEARQYYDLEGLWGGEGGKFVMEIEAPQTLDMMTVETIDTIRVVDDEHGDDEGEDEEEDIIDELEDGEEEAVTKRAKSGARVKVA